MPLYEVAVIEHPTPKQKEDGGVEKLLMPPKSTIAKDPQTAAIFAIMDTPLPDGVDRSRLEVLVRPFAG